MGGLRQSSKVNSNLGQLHLVSGTVSVTSGAWTITSNDPTVTGSDSGTAGNYVVTFGEAFLTVPHVFVAPFKVTHEATVFYNVMVESKTTTTAEFQVHHDTAGTNTTADPDDGDGFDFFAIGLRNN